MSNQIASQYLDQEPCSLPWLGSFPTHWKLAPGFAVLRERQVKNVGMAEKTVLSLSYGRVIVKPEEKLRGLVPESFETYQIVEPGNIIIRPTDLQNDQVSLRVGQVKDRGIITSAYLCLEAYGDLSADYAHLLLLAYDLKKVFYGLGSGLRQNLSWNDFRRLPIPLPSRLEQEQIVRFVRHLDSKVNRLIKAKRRLIELLNEQKQAIIHQAITRGLDPNIPFKPSGIDWLGEIPAHWSMVRIKSLVRMKSGDGITSDQIEEKGEFPVFGGNGLRGFTNAYTHDGDFILIGRQGALCGNIQFATGRFWASEHAVVCTGAAPFNIKWLGELLRVMNLNQYSISAAQPGLAIERIKNLRLPVPPAEEQDRIVEWIKSETAGLENVLAKARTEIELIREYRTRLVADVVTGQLDVRHIKLLTLDEIDVEAPEAEEVDDLDLDSLPEDGVLF